MNVNGVRMTSIWVEDDGRVMYVDQNRLPWELVVRELKTVDDAVRAIVEMEVRGAPLIGVCGAFGYWLGESDAGGVYERLLNTRPTAVNLKWALDIMQATKITPNPPRIDPNPPELTPNPPESPSNPLLSQALSIMKSEIERSKAIGEYGLSLIKDLFEKTGKTVHILTHCNAGWLATVEYGTATAPIYMAHDAGIPVHVWVDETRPRNQGARLTAWELSQHGVPCTVIPDNTGGHLMQNGMVDLVLVGTDRVAANGDVANKIGTYLKALAARENNIPFCVAMPWSSYDPTTKTGKDIVIEERGDAEVRFVEGDLGQFEVNSGVVSVKVVPDGVAVANYGFDITPAHLITNYISETGIHHTLTPPPKITPPPNPKTTPPPTPLNRPQSGR